MARCSACDGRGWRRKGRPGRLRPARDDSFRVEVEGDAAEIPVVFDLLCGASVDGGERRRASLGSAMAVVHGERGRERGRR